MCLIFLAPNYRVGSGTIAGETGGMHMVSLSRTSAILRISTSSWHIVGENAGVVRLPIAGTSERIPEQAFC